MEIPDFNTKKELFDFLVKNKYTLIAQKKAQIKYADAIIFPATIITLKDSINKAEDENIKTNDVRVKIVINTTNFMDSYKDVHMPGLWGKSIKENKGIMHIKEHKMEFESIIADGKDLIVYTKIYPWSELGFNFSSNTEALIFESLIKYDRNAFMAEQYKKGYVKNHSVGMQYVKIIMCVNDEDYGAEYEAWEKYYPEIANKELADEYGYFWAVKEAKIIEGSSVPRGSNYATPTLDVNESKNEPDTSTQQKIEPPLKGTQIDYKYLFNGVKNLKTN